MVPRFAEPRSKSDSNQVLPSPTTSSPPADEFFTSVTIGQINSVELAGGDIHIVKIQKTATQFAPHA